MVLRLITDSCVSMLMWLFWSRITIVICDFSGFGFTSSDSEFIMPVSRQ